MDCKLRLCWDSLPASELNSHIVRYIKYLRYNNYRSESKNRFQDLFH